MTNDEVRQQMDFILSQQAQTVVNLQTLSEKQVQVEQRVSNLEGAFISLTTIVADVGTKIGEVAEAQKRLQLSMEKLEVKMAETDERLNSFINFVERYFSDRQNGHSQN